jgi:hypothetical protein
VTRRDVLRAAGGFPVALAASRASGLAEAPAPPPRSAVRIARTDSTFAEALFRRP